MIEDMGRLEERCEWMEEGGRKRGRDEGPFKVGSQCCLSERILKLSSGCGINSLLSTSLDGECFVGVGNVCNSHA